MSYVLEGPKWGSATRGTTATITWSFADQNLTSVLNQTYDDYPALTGAISPAYRDVIRSAFTTWANVTGLTFSERSDSALNNLRVGALYIDGSGSTLATTQYYQSNGVYLKAAIDFDTDSLADSSTLYAVALHEIGHAIGLDHSASPNDVMYPYLGAQNKGLSFDDVSGARVLYSNGLTLQGTSGDDVLSGGALSDLLYGLNGADTIIGGEGNNILVGGTDSTDAADLITAGSGNDLIFGNGGDDTISSTGGNDIAVGGFGSDRIVLGGGNDIVYGNQGDDVIDAGDGNNLIIGGRGNDTLQAGAGADIIWGNEGDDVMDGGPGADRYVFGTGSGADQIVGFNAAEGDRLDLLGQSYTLGVATNGNALLLLSGGGSIQLLGVPAGAYSPAFIA